MISTRTTMSGVAWLFIILVNTAKSADNQPVVVLKRLNVAKGLKRLVGEVEQALIMEIYAADFEEFGYSTDPRGVL